MTVPELGFVTEDGTRDEGYKDPKFPNHATGSEKARVRPGRCGKDKIKVKGV